PVQMPDPPVVRQWPPHEIPPPQELPLSGALLSLGPGSCPRDLSPLLPYVFRVQQERAQQQRLSVPRNTLALPLHNALVASSLPPALRKRVPDCTTGVRGA